MELPGILISPLWWCNATWLFLWFHLKLSHFQSENAKKIFFFAAKFKQALCLFSKLSLFFFLPIMARVIQKLEHMPQTASSIERLECLVKLNAFCNEAVAIC